MLATELACTADATVTVVSAAAGRMRVHANGFAIDATRAAAIEESVGRVGGVRAVRAYPRTASVVIWYSPAHCDTAAIVSAIAEAEHAGDASAPAPTARAASVADGGVVGRVIGGLARALLGMRTDDNDDDPRRRSRDCARRWIASATRRSRTPRLSCRRVSRPGAKFASGRGGPGWRGRWVCWPLA